MILKNNKIGFEYKNIYELTNEKIGIPMFQRFYDWKDKQISQLLEDIDTLVIDPNGQLYLLDFIFYYEDGLMMLADGQQRIVTLNLLIKAINNFIDMKGLRIGKLKPFNIRYEISENDVRYKQMMQNYPVAPFKTVYLELIKYLESHPIKDIPKIASIIKNNIYIYNKKCKNSDDAFRIFQQINTGGKPLSKDEVIKTALDQYSEIYDVELNTSKIKEIRQSIISFYKYVEDDYGANFDNMLIMSFMKKYITKDRDTFINFVNYIDKLRLNDDTPISYIIKYINRPLLFDVLNILSIKNISVEKNKKYQDELMIPLCLCSVTLSLNNGTPPRFKYLVNAVIRMIKEDEKLNEIQKFIAEEISKNDVFKIRLSELPEKLDSNLCSLNMKKAILLMDVAYRNTSGSIIVDNINLEHIYPQNPISTWHRNDWPANHEAGKKLCNNIGNLILLCESVNKKIQNEYITDKVDEYKKIISKDIILQTKMNTVDFKKFEEKRDKYIFDRAKLIANSIMTDLPFGKVLIKE